MENLREFLWRNIEISTAVYCLSNRLPPLAVDIAIVVGRHLIRLPEGAREMTLVGEFEIQGDVG
jgi:hypothetical protein